MADVVVKLPGQIFGSGDEVLSIQSMASLLEQALLLFTAALVFLLIDRAKVDRAVIYGRHTNPPILFTNK